MIQTKEIKRLGEKIEKAKKDLYFEVHRDAGLHSICNVALKQTKEAQQRILELTEGISFLMRKLDERDATIEHREKKVKGLEDKLIIKTLENAKGAQVLSEAQEMEKELEKHLSRLGEAVEKHKRETLKHLQTIEACKVDEELWKVLEEVKK